ncbi:MAG: MFS transporter [Christensenellales bacterium]
MKNDLLFTLKNLKGNPKACLLTEPLWSIPYNLYIPFASVYAKALGLSESQIGLIATVGMLFQVLASLFGGLVCDKMGRRKSTVIFDILAWSVPMLLWMVAQNFWWFLAASIMNSMWQITNNSWNCLLVEDADPKQLVSIYIWVSISGLLSVFFAPLSSLLVKELTVIPAMRILYGVTFLLMTAKFLILYWTTTETRIGIRRMEETKDLSYITMLRQYGGVTKNLLRSRPTLLVLTLMTLVSITNLVTGTYYSIYVTEELGLPTATLALLPMLWAAVMLVFNLGLQGFLTKLPFRPVMLTGLLMKIAGFTLLMLAPHDRIGWIIAYALLSAIGNGLFLPRVDSLKVLLLDSHERARTQALMYVLTIGVASPFGWLMGWLYEVNPQIPFYALVGLLLSCFLLCAVTKNLSPDNLKTAEIQTQNILEGNTAK